MADINKSKILGMLAAAKLQLEELRFDPREFIAKLEDEVGQLSTFERPGFVADGVFYPLDSNPC